MDADRIALADLARGSVRNIPRGPADYVLGEGGALLQQFLDGLASMTKVDVRKPAPWGTVGGKFIPLPSVMDRIGSVSSENLLGRPGDVMEKGSYGFPISPVEALDLANVVAPATLGARGIVRGAAREVAGEGAGMTLAGSRGSQGGLIGKKVPSPADINAAIKGEADKVAATPWTPDDKITHAMSIFNGVEYPSRMHFEAINQAIADGNLAKVNGKIQKRPGDRIDLFKTESGRIITKAEAEAGGAPSVKSEEMDHGKDFFAAKPAPGSPAEINAKIRTPVPHKVVDDVGGAQ